MTSELISTLRKDVQLDDAEAEYILSFFEKRNYKRGASLLKGGMPASEVFFVVEGALHQFYVDDSGTEKSCNFAFENEFITDLESFLKQTAASSQIKALTETSVLCLRCKDMAVLLRELPAVSLFFRMLVERLAAESMERTKSLLAYTPQKRFLDLAYTRPDILQRVPQRYIAQYLGIAPESLSRIRKRLFTEAKS
ncbi:Crp/Fnr family transcriptional regulator [Dyadobacter sediminis]|uniref:Crp/Fnr family transcriptional regulator n=1 Tax=Dyadobacter sediminis TaxID=1493691 RepID=A0A5R9KIU2_9BACT|nr:Crp/Fnr family transcriptional regulator [Dyadobacter sediminis]TLU96102.1 Crp/Fnr family transcriptional regulator [Dyadobacter sediminis]GGB79249.1 cyclic nucleotide-binding protein [Dyadobacter sediminis]